MLSDTQTDIKQYSVSWILAYRVMNRKYTYNVKVPQNTTTSLLPVC